MNPRQRALAILALSDPLDKAAQARALFAGLDDAAIDPAAQYVAPTTLPGRPDRPRLVAHKDVPTRSPFTLEGRAALLHAVTHIEINAIKTVWSVDTSPGGSRATKGSQFLLDEASRASCVQVERPTRLRGTVLFGKFGIRRDRIEATLSTNPAVPTVANGNVPNLVAQDDVENLPRAVVNTVSFHMNTVADTPTSNVMLRAWLVVPFWS